MIWQGVAVIWVVKLDFLIATVSVIVIASAVVVYSNRFVVMMVVVRWVTVR
jgi:hypothetical protein